MGIPNLSEPYSRKFLLDHCQSILDFYDPVVIDKSGGFYHNFKDNGETFAKGFRQLVSSTRLIVNYARASVILNKPEYAQTALHGLSYLENAHWQASTQSYAWTLQDHKPLDMTQQNYGYAFVLLAYAAIQKAGIAPVDDKIAMVFELMEQRFWQPKYGLYADELSAEGVLSEYRGQNANMHSCEAMIAAFDASKDERYLHRAQTIAENITVRQASQTDGLIWEHYNPDFSTDWDYNRDDPKNLYRPWGFQPGHQTEWAKLLVQIHRHAPSAGLLECAKQLFTRSFELAWDKQHGGLIYGFDPDYKWCDDDKYFWVQAESFAAAALLYQETGETHFMEAYQQLWQYCWKHLVDQQYGAWFRILTRENNKITDEKSSAGAKCDYHTLCACFDVLSGI